MFSDEQIDIGNGMLQSNLKTRHYRLERDKHSKDWVRLIGHPANKVFMTYAEFLHWFELETRVS